MKPLTKKQRFISIILLFIIFIFAAPIIVFYSLGYRIDSEFTFQKTGGIFIQSSIPNASVFVEDEYFKDNGLFLRNILVQDLKPNKTYKIEIQKDGYQSWVKNMFVYPSIVTEGQVLMLPNEYEVREILPYVDAEGTLTATPSRLGALPNNPEYISILEIFDPEEEIEDVVITARATDSTEIEEVKPKTKLDLFFEELEIEDYEELSNLIIEGNEVSWLDKGNIVLHWIDETSTTPFYYCGGLERECKTKMLLDWVNPIVQFSYFPGRFDVWVVLVDDGIFAVEIDDRSARNIQTIYTGDNLDYRLISGGRLLIRDDSSFFEINL